MRINMKEVKVGTFEVKAEVSRTMIDDLNSISMIDVAKIEEEILKRLARPSYRKKSINKIFNS